MSRFADYTMVRTLVPHHDMHGRPVPAGTVGYIVHSYEAAVPAAYIIEVVVVGNDGLQKDAYIFDARESDLVEGPTRCV